MPVPSVAIAPINPPSQFVIALLGDGQARPEADGGWAVIDRPKWTGFTEWQGNAPYKMSIPLMFDGHDQDRSIENEIELLRQMMRPVETPRNRPPIIRILGPIPHTNLEWVIDKIDYGDEIRRPDGQRVRQFFVLNVLEWVAPDILISFRGSPAVAAAMDAAATPSSDTTTGAAPSGKTYTVRSGDTLSSIAARQLGSAARWKEIADLNGIRDPKKLSVGQVLRLP